MKILTMARIREKMAVIKVTRLLNREQANVPQWNLMATPAIHTKAAHSLQEPVEMARWRCLGLFSAAPEEWY